MKRLESNQTKQSWFCCPIHFTGVNCRRQDFLTVPFIYLLRIQIFRERYCGWFWVRCSSKKYERMAREAMDVCLRVLKESNKRSFDRYSVWNSVLIISHITFRDRRVHILADNLSRNSCIRLCSRWSSLPETVYKKYSENLAFERQTCTSENI